eukprot:scaffold224224_cov28-Tisochrysis_lutea.AAC.10
MARRARHAFGFSLPADGYKPCRRTASFLCSSGHTPAVCKPRMSPPRRANADEGEHGGERDSAQGQWKGRQAARSLRL